MADASVETQVPSFAFLGSMHEGIPVDNVNLDACIKFYTEVLGLKLLKRPKALDDIGRGAWLGDTDDKVQFHLIATERDYKPGPGTKYSPTGRHTAWLVKDIEAFRARMVALGIEYGEAKTCSVPAALSSSSSIPRAHLGIPGAIPEALGVVWSHCPRAVARNASDGTHFAGQGSGASIEPSEQRRGDRRNGFVAL